MRKITKVVKNAGDFIFHAKGWLTGVALSVWAFMSAPDALGNISTSKLATGTQKLITDLTAWLLVVAPLVTVVAVIYFLIRKTIADEMDAKRWDSRIKVALICCIGVVVASGLINLIIGYYK